MLRARDDNGSLSKSTLLCKDCKKPCNHSENGKQESCRILCLFYPSFLIIYDKLSNINIIVFYENISLKLISGLTCFSQLVAMVSVLENLL